MGCGSSRVLAGHERSNITRTNVPRASSHISDLQKLVSREATDGWFIGSAILRNILDFIKQDLEQEEIIYGDNSAQFYLRLMVPREAWPRDNYGWLSDSHMAAAMLMFHRRSMQSTSPYSSSRIAFLDRWFVNTWVNDYNKIVKDDNKPLELSDMYSKAFNGEYPEQFLTG